MRRLTLPYPTSRVEEAIPWLRLTRGHVGVDQTWVLRVLKRVAADLDRLSGQQSPADEDAGDADPITAGVKRRRRFAEPEPDWSSLSQREQRAILREKIGLPPL